MSLRQPFAKTLAILLLASGALTGRVAAQVAAPGIQYVTFANGTHTECIALEEPEVELMLGIWLDRSQRTATPHPGPGASENLATFNVNYNGFTPQAQAAFQRAVDIWASILNSGVAISITANWTPLDPGVLGSAGPGLIWRDFSTAPMPGTWYASALANSLEGVDLDGGSNVEIVANFNSNFPNWYLGVDANPGPGEFDLVTVVLHELGHGLGFFDTFDVSGSNGSWGISGFPAIYDRFLEDGGGIALLNTAAYPNPSMALEGALTSNSVLLQGVAVNDCPVFAPDPFAPGSSIAHWDESSFPPGHRDSLMTPALSTGEAKHDPGAKTNAMFQEQGWDLNMSDGCSFLCDVGIGTVTPTEALHVRRADGTAAVRVEDASGTTANRNMFALVNNGGPQFFLQNTALGLSWFFAQNANGSFQFSRQGTGGAEFLIQTDGRVVMGPGPVENFDLRANGDLFIPNGMVFHASHSSLKEKVEPVSGRAILEKLDLLEISSWQYKTGSGERHFGPMAEDFYRLFSLGADDRSIAPLDSSGIALAAVQELQRQLRDRDRVLQQQANRIAVLETELAAIRTILEQNR